jgi:hypothetical protein
VLDSGAVTPGGVLGGQVHLRGGDADFDKTEQAVVREACYALDLPPHEFDL